MMQRARGAHLEVARIQSEINRLFEMLLRLRDGDDDAGAWSPPVDVSESPTHLVVEIEAPGVDPESLEIRAESGDLFVRGVRRQPAHRSADGAEVLHDEREYGAFERVIPLTTAVNTRAAVARVAYGVLRIELPRVPNRRGQAVPIPLQAE